MPCNRTPFFASFDVFFKVPTKMLEGYSIKTCEGGIIVLMKVL